MISIMITTMTIISTIDIMTSDTITTNPNLRWLYQLIIAVSSVQDPANFFLKIGRSSDQMQKA